MADIQTVEFAPDWVFTSLWSNKGERAVVDIPDTVSPPLHLCACVVASSRL
jgi:hypothetical protein